MDVPPPLVPHLPNHAFCSVATDDIVAHGRAVKVRLRGLLEGIVKEDHARRQHYLSLIRSNACVRRWVLTLARDLLQKELPQTEARARAPPAALDAAAPAIACACARRR